MPLSLSLSPISFFSNDCYVEVSFHTAQETPYHIDLNFIQRGIAEVAQGLCSPLLSSG